MVLRVIGRWQELDLLDSLFPIRRPYTAIPLLKSISHLCHLAQRGSSSLDILLWIG